MNLAKYTVKGAIRREEFGHHTSLTGSREKNPEDCFQSEHYHIISTLPQMKKLDEG
jgi:hypothetical protein